MGSDAFRACVVKGVSQGGDGPAASRSSPAGEENYIKNRLCDYFVTVGSRRLASPECGDSRRMRPSARSRSLVAPCTPPPLPPCSPSRAAAAAEPLHGARQQGPLGRPGRLHARLDRRPSRSSRASTRPSSTTSSTGAATSTGSACGSRTPSARTRARCCRSRTEETGLSLRDLARGGGDGFLVGLNRLVAEHGEVVYLRPLSEMNNANNPYSRLPPVGCPRGPAFTTAWFKKAWRRIALVVRGGDVATINSKLRRLGLPPVRTGAGRAAARRRSR